MDQSSPDRRSHKAELRARARQARRDKPVATRLSEDRARTGVVLAALRDVEPATIACYLSVPPHATNPEPGTIELVTALWTLGHRVLVPVLSPTPDGPRHDVAWGWFTGPADLRPGLWGIPDPSGDEVFDASALSQADLVLCSALLATEQGVRLGVGGGWYDRALAHRRDGSPVWALVADDEVVDELPREDHDVLVDALVLPSGLRVCR